MISRQFILYQSSTPCPVVQAKATGNFLAVANERSVSSFFNVSVDCDRQQSIVFEGEPIALSHCLKASPF
ncbi:MULTISPECIES: hypothetical protein [unclassified Microcoleus]|uniref:hypothetical protein n=1 Tax=unclassified Microcoleus TaxID=2642155 RepID=UPI0025EDBFD6|nr:MULTISPECIES: hypothetical protein [unclassified Microcoleus]